MPQQYSDNPLDKQFRDKLSGSSVQPRKRVWNRIAGELQQANRRKAIGGRMLYISLITAAAAAITATLLFMPALTRQITVGNRATTAQVIKNAGSTKESTIESPKASTVQNTAPVNHLPIKGGNNAGALKEQLTTLNNNVQSTLSFLNNTLQQVNSTSSVTSNQREDIAPLALTVQSLPIETYPVPNLTEVNAQDNNSNTLTINNIPDLQKANIQSSICIKGLYVGGSFALNNTWLMDKKALANYDFKYNLTVGRTVAVKVGYNFTNNFGIESGCNVIAEEGQDYTFNPPVFARVEPSNLDNRVKLTYTQIPLLAKYKFVKTSGLTHHTVALNINVGAQYGILHSISNTVNDENAEYANFKKSELAAVAGIGYDVYLSQKWFISTGVQFSYSSNLYNTSPASSYYTGQASSYDQFSSPHSLVGGVYLGINYAITGCR